MSILRKSSLLALAAMGASHSQGLTSAEANLAAVASRSAEMARRVRRHMPGAVEAEAAKIKAAIDKRDRKAAKLAARGKL